MTARVVVLSGNRRTEGVFPSSLEARNARDSWRPALHGRRTLYSSEMRTCRIEMQSFKARLVMERPMSRTGDRHDTRGTAS